MVQVAISHGQAGPLPYPFNGLLGAQPHKGDPGCGMGTQERGVALLLEMCSGISWGTEVPWESGMSLPPAASLED